MKLLSLIQSQRVLYWYYLYKEYALPTGVAIVCIIVLSVFIPTQVQRLLVLNDEANQTRQKIQVLSANGDILEGVDQSTLDRYLALSHEVLPSEKDFNGILQAVSNASFASKVQVGDFGIEIGDIAPSYSKVDTLSTIPVVLTVEGNLEEVKQFLSQLSKIFPLSQAMKVQVEKTGARIELLFYFKPFPPGNANSMPIKPLSDKELSLLSTLSLSQETLALPSLEAASSSAVKE